MAIYRYHTAYRINDWDVRNRVSIPNRGSLHPVEDWLRDRQRPGEYTMFVERDMEGDPAVYTFAFSNADLAFEFKMRWA